MNTRSAGITTSLLFFTALGVACSSSADRSGFGDPPADKSDAGESFGDGENDHKCTDRSDPDFDSDKDGYPVKFDCDDCDPNVNNGSFEIAENGVDDDCNGDVDEEPDSSDADISIDTSDAFEAARAIGLWKKADPKGRDWGVIAAAWVLPDGKKLSDLRGAGVVPSFGVNEPPSGSTMLALSSGYARAPDQDGWEESMTKGYESGTPAGYPKESKACEGVASGEAHDGTSLLLKIRVPSNVKSFSYQQFFLTHEYPRYICSTYNDFFVTIMTPKPAGQKDGNIAFDQDGNPISVNNSLLQVCEPSEETPTPFPCPLGNELLAGTGFDHSGGFGPDEPGGGTGWLTTSAPVKPGSEITLLFSIWDSGDTSLDSTVLIDDFQFSLDDAKIVTKPTVK